MSIKLLLIRQSFEVRLDEQGHNGRRIVCEVLTQVVDFRHGGPWLPLPARFVVMGCRCIRVVYHHRVWECCPDQGFRSCRTETALVSHYWSTHIAAQTIYSLTGGVIHQQRRAAETKRVVGSQRDHSCR